MEFLKRYGIDAVIMVAIFVICLMALEVFHTWQRVNVLWQIAVQNEQRAQAQAQAQQQQSQRAQAPVGESRE